MVGTKPIVFPLRRAWRATAIISSISTIRSMTLTALLKALFLCRKYPPLHFIPVAIDRLQNDLFQIHVALDKLGGELAVQPQQVVADQNLSVAVRPRTDADGRNPEMLGDARRQRAWNSLEHHRESSGLLYTESLFQQAFLGFRSPTLNLVTSKGVNGLGGETDMSHHRNAGLHHRPDLLPDPLSSFEFDRLRPTFLDEPSGIPHGFRYRNLVSQKRHIGHHHRCTVGARHRCRMPDHVLKRHRQSGRMPQDHHSQGISYQEDVDPPL